MSTKIGILDPQGNHDNPLTNKPYSQHYRDLGKVWSHYPAYQKANEILASIATNQVTLIISGTGSGKTVLIPKFALHYTNYQGRIAITLPKRTVTLSAAMFAAETLDVVLGSSVGYVYKGSDKKMVNDANRLVYMTDGSLIAKLSRDPTLSEYNVIIIDEAHERKVQIDLLLLFLKNILMRRKDLKVIIMSATLDGNKYQKYFHGLKSNIIHISGQPNHEITVHFLDQTSGSYMIEGLKLIEGLVDQGIKKDMLFFITTSTEAFQLCKSIRLHHPAVYCVEVFADMDSNLKVYATSSDKYLELGNYDQKLIMATNVAESSITIDGLKYVIDSGYELYSYFDPEHFAQILEKRLISKAQALQRRGRVGRTEPGICYHLLTAAQFNKLNEYQTPDILRQDISVDFIKVIQQTETKKYTDGYKLLEQLMDVPTKPYITIATDLYKLYNIIDAAGVLTKVGNVITHFSSLPINRSLFLMYGYQSYCAREVSIIIAMMEKLHNKFANLFYKADSICESDCAKPASKRLLATLVKKRSDHLTLLNIYKQFSEAKEQKLWTNKYGIRIELLNAVTKLSNDYYHKILGISRPPPPSRVQNINIDDNIITALKQSHQHLIADHMKSTYARRQIPGQINKDSLLHLTHTKKELENKKFIYDEFVSINGSWEFSVVTLI